MQKQWKNYCFYWALREFDKKGSHAFYRQKDGRTTTIPHHKGRVLARPLIKEILREIEVTIDKYNELLRKL